LAHFGGDFDIELDLGYLNLPFWGSFSSFGFANVSVTRFIHTLSSFSLCAPFDVEGEAFQNL